MKICASGLVAMLILISSSGQSLAAGKKMTASQIKQLFVDKELAYSGPTKGSQTFYANGTVKTEDSKWGNLVGKWWFSGNQYCRKLSSDGGKNYGKAACITFYDHGSNTYSSSNGYSFTYK